MGIPGINEIILIALTRDPVPIPFASGSVKSKGEVNTERDRSLEIQ